MNASKGALAAAAATFFLSAVATVAVARSASAADDKVKCEGVNSCKGSGACRSAANSCAGKNGCAGKGFLMLTPEECQKAKDDAAKDAAKR
jgi:uncharacterized membrane protein